MCEIHDLTRCGLGTLVLIAQEQGIQLSRKGGNLVIRGPASVLTPDFRDALAQYKPVLLPHVGVDRVNGRTWLSPKLYWLAFWAPRPEWHINSSQRWSAKTSGNGAGERKRCGLDRSMKQKG